MIILINMGFDTIIFNRRPLASLVRLTQTISGRLPNPAAGAWPDIIPLALRANLKPFVNIHSLIIIREAMVIFARPRRSG